MKLSAATRQELSKIIMGDQALTLRRTGPQIISFFNDFFDEKDTYDRSFPSRRQYVELKLEQLNGSVKLKNLITEVFDPIHFDNILANVKEILSRFNGFLTKDGFIAEIILTNSRLCIQVSSLNHELINFKNNKINSAFISDQIKKCDSKILKGDLDGAITNSRSLVEAVMEFIVQDLGYEIPKYDGELSRLYKEVKAHLNLHSEKDISDTLKQFLSGLTSIVTALAGLSNKMSDRHARQYAPLPHHARLAVNSAFTICNFLLDTLEYQKTSK